MNAQFPSLARTLPPILFSGLLAVFVAAGCVEEQQDPGPAPPQVRQPGPGQEALLRVVEAETSLVYSGFKRIVSGPRGTSRETRMQVARHADGRTVAEWSAGDSVLRWAFETRFPWIDRPELLLANYTVTLSPNPGPTVASRETRKLLLRASTPGRPSLELLVDAEKWLVLQHELRDHEGSVRHTGFFESIDFSPSTIVEDGAAESLEEPAGDTQDPDVVVEGWTPLVVSVPPKGFERVSRTLDAGGALCEYWSDGLAAFLFKQSPATELSDDDPPPGEIVRDERAGRVRLWGVLEGVHLSVEGTLPAGQLETLVRGLVRPH